MTLDELQREVEELSGTKAPAREHARNVVEALIVALESGSVRSAEPCEGDWRVNRWVKQGILLGFRIGHNKPSAAPPFHFRDRETYPTWDPATSDRNVRIVPGGSTVRRGSYLGRDVVVMPPAYVNVGAYVGDGAMVDSHALVGSCAQIGAGVHLSAAAQVGGVLEPVGAFPVIVEDEVFVGGGCGIYEGTRVCSRAVLAPGVILTASVPVYDTVHGVVYRAEGDRPLKIPAGAVVVPGSRPAAGEFAGRHGLQLQTPVVVKYRGEATDAALALEEALR